MASATFPNSRKVYVSGSRPDVRVPMREISQSPTAGRFGERPNPPVRVYDTSGPGGELTPLRRPWILERGDVFEHGGRLRARPGRTVTQTHYARRGVVTPEMEFVAI